MRKQRQELFRQRFLETGAVTKRVKTTTDRFDKKRRKGFEGKGHVIRDAFEVKKPGGEKGLCRFCTRCRTKVSSSLMKGKCKPVPIGEQNEAFLKTKGAWELEHIRQKGGGQATLLPDMTWWQRWCEAGPSNEEQMTKLFGMNDAEVATRKKLLERIKTEDAATNAITHAKEHERKQRKRLTWKGRKIKGTKSCRKGKSS